MKLIKSKLFLILFLLLLVFAISISSMAQKSSQTGSFDALAKSIAAIAAHKPGNSIVGITVIDVISGKEIYSLNGDKSLNPASNAKVVTAACALKILGPEFKFTTSLYGKKTGNIIHGSLYIKGHADPTLKTSDLWQMVRQLKSKGIKRIEGGIVVDDTYFDDQNLPFAYDQQPDEDNKFRAPVGAVSLNYNALAITIKPGVTGMVKARISFNPPGYAIATNDTITVGQGAHNPKISAATFEDRTRVRVWGQVPLGSGAVTYYRRIDNPSLFTGYGLKGVLAESGISVGGDVRVGTVSPRTPLLASHKSLPLSSVLWETGKMSNNFVTEMILKTIGAEITKGSGTWQASTEAVATVLENWGVAKGSYQYKNGSGLFNANNFSTRQFVKVLRGAYLDAGIRPEFLSQLATGGVDGTIKSRYRSKETKRHVRAKTGTLSSVSALTGFVFDKEGNRPIAFSILLNRASGYVSVARGYQEKITTAIAKFLNP